MKKIVCSCINSPCKKCVRRAKKRAWDRDYYQKNKEALKAYAREWHKKDPIRRKEVKKKWDTENRHHLNEYTKNRLKTDLNFKLRFSLRSRIRAALKDNMKPGSAVALLGCTILELKHYLEARFQPGMTWENWGREGWHIDHVKPLAAFDLTDFAQFSKACHYTNLQPLWAIDNLKKRSLDIQIRAP